LATGEETPGEEMGGWRVHAQMTGLVDMIAESDQEAMNRVKEFLSYLPSNASQPPPTAPIPEHSGEKITSFLVLCDSYNIPIVMLVDTPGFLVGKAGERRKITGKIVNFMNALTLVTVPKITIILRKTYGQAFLNMGGGRNSDIIVAWPSAEISFMAPETGVNVVFNLRKEDDLAKFTEKFNILNRDTEPWSAAGIFNLNDVIDPTNTRIWLMTMLDFHQNQTTGGVGQHRMHCWPTSY